MFYRKSMPYDVVWTTAYKVTIQNVNKPMVIKYKRELGFFFSIQGSAIAIMTEIVIIYSDTNIKEGFCI